MTVVTRSEKDPAGDNRYPVRVHSGQRVRRHRSPTRAGRGTALRRMMTAAARRSQIILARGYRSAEWPMSLGPDNRRYFTAASALLAAPNLRSTRATYFLTVSGESCS